MDTPKRQHFVPKMLLNRFVDKNGLLYFFSKRSSVKKILKSTPANLFIEGHLYTLYDELGDKNVLVEKLLSDIETDANPIIEKIVNAARASRQPKLNPSEKKIWNLFFCCQLVRVPEMIDPYLNNFDKMVSEIAEEFEGKFGPLTSEERIKIDDPDKLDRIRHNVRAAAVVNYLSEGELLPALEKKGLAIGIICNPKKSFIVGSNPHIKTSDWNHFSDRNAEIWLPVAHDIIVSPYFSPNIEKLIKIKENNKIREFNKHIFKQSSLIAGRSPKLIASLAGINQRL